MPTHPSSLKLKTLCFAALLCAAAGASADITVYTNQADFLGAVYAAGTDTYDDLSPQLYGDVLNRSAGPYKYDVYSARGLYGAGGPGDSWLSNNYSPDPIVFSNFGTDVAAFGGNFFSTDVNGQYVPGSVSLTALDGSVLTYTVDASTTSSFVGFVSTAPLNAVVLTSNNGEAYWGTANNVVLAVPEPSTYAMLLAGLGFVGLVSRRRG